MQRVFDGALNVDVWPHLVLPREIHAAWSPLVSGATADIGLLLACTG